MKSGSAVGRDGSGLITGLAIKHFFRQRFRPIQVRFNDLIEYNKNRLEYIAGLVDQGDVLVKRVEREG